MRENQQARIFDEWFHSRRAFQNGATALSSLYWTLKGVLPSSTKVQPYVPAVDRLESQRSCAERAP